MSSTLEAYRNMKSTTNDTPVLYVLLRSVGDTLDNAWVRVSRDVMSAHAFSQAFLLNKFNYLYTNLEVAGITTPHFPDTVYLAIGQKKPHELSTLGLGLFKTMEEAKEAAVKMHKHQTEFTSFYIKTCQVQLGLDEEDDEFLENLSDAGFKRQMEELGQSSD